MAWRYMSQESLAKTRVHVLAAVAEKEVDTAAELEAVSYKNQTFVVVIHHSSGLDPADPRSGIPASPGGTPASPASRW